jgi:hypothetical protein
MHYVMMNGTNLKETTMSVEDLQERREELKASREYYYQTGQTNKAWDCEDKLMDVNKQLIRKGH